MNLVSLLEFGDESESSKSFMKMCMKLAEKEMNESEKQFVLNNVYKVHDYPQSKVSMASRYRDKVYVTFDFEHLSSMAAPSYGGTYNKRLGILVAAELIHEATHNVSMDDEKKSVENVDRFLKRKNAEKSILFIRMFMEVNLKIERN